MNPHTALCGLLALMFVGCASYGPQSLAPGTSIEAAHKSLGPPTGEYPLPEGARRLEYARGPYGRHTYMLDFDADGKLVRWEQVLSEARFKDIVQGMEAQQVLQLIGHSFEQRVVGYTVKQTVWAYRYETPFCQWFQVGIDPQGKVVDTAYGPDPACDHDTDRTADTP